jgi:hypothetical protein
MPMVVVAKIKGEAALWSAAGATHLGSIMPREWSFVFRVCTRLVTNHNSFLFNEWGKAFAPFQKKVLITNGATTYSR